METTNRQLKALMKKNLVLKKRNCGVTVCELLFPMILVLLIGIIKQIFPLSILTNIMTESDFLRTNSTMIIANKLASQNTKYGLNLKRTFSGACGYRNKYAVVGSGPYITQAIKMIAKIDSSIIPMEGYFPTMADLTKYVTSTDYNTAGIPEICFGFSIDKINTKVYNYTMNFFVVGRSGGRSSIPDPAQVSQNRFTNKPNLGDFNKWMNSGYLALVKILNDIIFQDATNTTTAKIDFGLLAQNYTTYLDDSKGRLLGAILPFFIVIGYLSPLIVLIYRILSEKENRSKEGMKMMGLSDGVYFASWFLEFLVINTIFALINSIILIIMVFKFIGFLWIFLLMWLYGMSVFSLGYFFCSFMDRTRIGLIFAILVYFVMYFVSLVSTSDLVSNTLKMLASLLPPTCLQLGLNNFIYFDTNLVQFTNDDLSYEYQSYTMTNFYTMITVDIFVYIFLGFYLENVVPREFGTPRPFYFLFTKHYWCGETTNNGMPYQSVEIKDVSLGEDKSAKSIRENYQDESNYEDQIKSGDCFKFNNLVKEYEDGKVAVNKLTFNLYKNEIFALLGHNGAGKSTLISMLAGLFPPTDGDAIYQNQNVFANMEEFRKKVGICPQHDVLFEQLTVREHLELFCIFKGVNEEVFEEEVRKIVNQMDINDIVDNEAGTLSGGQKRKLSIAIALVGGSEVVFLDEPSSGMDITSRRQLWDILKRCIDDRIIILTTHYMEEAAVLGNRVGIISEGELQCLGTPLFLIDRFGEYFTLSFRITPDTKVDKIIEFVASKYEGVKHLMFTEEITFQIDRKKETNLKNFFLELDSITASLGVVNYSVSMPSLEDVFLTVANREHDKFKKNNGDVMLSVSDESKTDIIYTYDRNSEPEISECSKFMIDLKFSLKKRLLQIVRDTKTFVMEILCPIILVLIGLGVSSAKFVVESNTKLMEKSVLSNQTVLVNRIPLLSNNSNINSEFLLPYSTSNINYQMLDWNNSTDNVTQSLINYNLFLQAKNDTVQNGNFLITRLDTTNHIHEFILISNLYTREGPPIFIQEMITNIMRTDLKQINMPMPLTDDQKNKSESTNDNTLVFFVSIAFALIPSSFITLIIRERENNVKHLQIISGISHMAYWLSNFIFELVKYYFTTGACLLIILAFDKFPDNLYILYLLYGISMVPFTYTLSFFFKNESLAQNITIFINFLIGALGGAVLVILRVLEDTSEAAKGLAYILRVVPSFAFSYAYNTMLSFTNFIRYDFPDDPTREEDELNVNYVGADIIYLGVFTVFFIFTLILLEYFYSIKQNVTTSHKPDLTDLNDPEVINEINQANNNDVSTEKEVLSVKIQNLEKVYSVTQGCEPTVETLAVNKLSLCLKFGECFGLLGVNGAGKTSTFKCLTNEEHLTGGNITINGLEITNNFNKIRHLVGYCPQFDAIFDFLSVYENLEFYANVKGISPDKIDPLIEGLMKELNLKQYKDKISGRLSGGNKRKLSVAIAMIGNPPIILLDEPSAGLDPESRKFMWSVINKISINRKQSSVILTTHSMEEAESLCKRIGIMVNGQFKCIGTSQSIKERYGSGYEIPLRIASIPEVDLNDILQTLSVNVDDKINFEHINQILIRMNKTFLIQYLTERDNLGSEIYNEVLTKNGITYKKFLNWTFYTENLIKFLRTFNLSFEEIRISEYLENNYTLEIQKNPLFSIGKVFGILEELKIECHVNEYSISQTSLEKIFNGFAKENEIKNLANMKAQQQQNMIEMSPIESLKIKRKEILVTKNWFPKTDDIQMNNFVLEKKLTQEFHQFGEVAEKKLTLSSNHNKDLN